MKKKVDPRIAREVGLGALPEHPALKSPWEKLVSYRDAAHYAQRYCAVVSAALLNAYRILRPDYIERRMELCEVAYDRLYGMFILPQVGLAMNDEHNVHPFCKGNFIGGLVGDAGDDALVMYGRVNDFGTYRVEKELDNCYWDIVGSEVCRATTQSLQGNADGQCTHLQPGPQLEYHMVEAKGCGDMHCRIVAENREKFPMPDHEQWECFGPVGSADQIKYTPEEDLLKEPMALREECDFTFVNGTCMERPSSSLYPMVSISNASFYILPPIASLIEKGKLDATFVDHVVKYVCQAAGKASFGEFYAKKGFCDWVGAPKDVDDGRLMGAHIEMFLQSMTINYEVEEFNSENVVLLIDRERLANGNGDRMILAYVSMWYGMTKSLVNAQWALWEEPEGAPADKLRIRITKKIDKFC
jgi:hypothetical protein